MSKKICLLTDSLGSGGAERMVSNLSISLSKKGYEIYIVTMIDDIICPYTGTLYNFGEIKKRSNKLNSFMKFYALDTSRQIADVSRRMQQVGGYDYYRNLTEAIRAHIQGRSQDEIQYILNNSSRPDEISYNKAAYDAFYERFGSNRKTEICDKKGSVRLAGGEIEIKVSPVFEIETAGVYSVFHVWASQTPKIDKSKAGIACFLMERALKKTASNYECKFFDAVSKKVYSGASNTASLAVDSLASLMVKWAKS